MEDSVFRITERVLTMFHKARDCTTVNAAARALGTYRLLVLALCELHGIPLVPMNGVQFLADESVGLVREKLAQWRARPRLGLSAHRRRATRTYAPWRPGRDNGDYADQVKRLSRAIARKFPKEIA